jgi:ABC-type transport system involved in multi-copper enzyme maturation permease subunit
MRRLLWKEWHEQSWKLGFGCIVLGALAMIGLRTRIVADMTMMTTVCFLGLALLPVLASTGLVPAERSEGVFESLLSLPVAPWRILSAKTIVGGLLCAGPLVVAWVVSWTIAGGREIPSGGVAILYERTILTSLCLFVWMVALTIHLPSETRAGLLGLGILIFWLMALFGMVSTKDPTTPRWLLGLCPLAFVTLSLERVPPFPLLLIEQLAIVAALWFWASRRMNTLSEASR